MLSRKFGKEVVNYYSGSRLNRISFLRPDTGFLKKAATSPSSRYVALENLNALVVDKTDLAYLSFEDVKPLIGAEPYNLTEEASIKEYSSAETPPILIFLGLLEDEEQQQQQQDVEFQSASHGTVKGRPYFAVDVTPKHSYKETAKTCLARWKEDKGLEIESSPLRLGLHAGAGNYLLSLSQYRFC